MLATLKVATGTCGSCHGRAMHGSIGANCVEAQAAVGRAPHSGLRCKEKYGARGTSKPKTNSHDCRAHKKLVEGVAVNHNFASITSAVHVVGCDEQKSIE